jgi:hypothetical protein
MENWFGQEQLMPLVSENNELIAIFVVSNMTNNQHKAKRKT